MQGGGGRLLVVVGVGLILAGLALLGKIPLFRLPGDLRVEVAGVVVYVPLATCLVLSAVLSLVSYLLR